MFPIVLYVARRALLYGIAYGIMLTAVVVAVTELTGHGREGGRLEAAAVVGAGLCAVLVLGQFGVGLAHVRAVRAAGRPAELAAVRVGQHGESELAASPAEVREAAARALKTLYGRPARSDGDGQLSAVRPGSRQRMAQRIVVRVEAAGGPERSVVRVSSAPRLGLSAWDMGQGAREVAEVLEAVRRRVG
ncbi:hypothetical protein C3489_08545 [Streptomyces sp. Ru71]|uniref:hypothetical protein n=1 Tax=Streptomyces sp. Ru71 TaxID=2080746 RepID=UPI000CDE2492|nr:hypothetical protein [Streptomyces sp. Ru71]POX55890.1 hypothetical protein C3489_08545 [Streptomyces sp. Ru71]